MCPNELHRLIFWLLGDIFSSHAGIPVYLQTVWPTLKTVSHVLKHTSVHANYTAAESSAAVCGDVRWVTSLLWPSCYFVLMSTFLKLRHVKLRCLIRRSHAFCPRIIHIKNNNNKWSFAVIVSSAVISKPSIHLNLFYLFKYFFHGGRKSDCRPVDNNELNLN